MDVAPGGDGREDFGATSAGLPGRDEREVYLAVAPCKPPGAAATGPLSSR